MLSVRTVRAAPGGFCGSVPIAARIASMVASSASTARSSRSTVESSGGADDVNSARSLSPLAG